MNCVQKQEKCLRSFALFVAVMVALLLAGATPAFAQCTDSWTGGDGNNNWSDSANWSNGMVPGSSDSVCITQSGAAVVLDVADGIADLTVGSSDSLTFPTVTNTNNGLNINGSSLANSGQIIMAPPISFGTTGLSLSSSGTTTLSGHGTITLNANSFGGDFIGGSAKLLNQSTIQGAGSFGMTFNNAKNGVVNANDSGAQLVVGRNNSQGASTNTGLMEATAGGQMAIGSLSLNNVGGTISASGTGSYVDFTNEGQGGQTITGGTFTTSKGGVIYSGNSTTLDGTNGNTITNKGTLAVNVTSNVQGTINNSGTFQILSNSGQAGVNIPGGQTFTLMGSGNLTMGDGTNNAYNNQNYISGATFVNQQLVQGTGGILNLASFNNSSTINANASPGTNNLQLQLGRAGASTNTGIIEASNGGALVIGSTTINNAGGTIEAVGANSNVSLVGSLGTSGLTISGGTYTTSGGGAIYGGGGTTLDGTTEAVTNSGTFIVNDGGNNINVQGTLSNTGTIEILSKGGSVYFQMPSTESLTITGSGKVIMGDGTDNSYNNIPTLGSDAGSSGVLTNKSTIEGTGFIGEYIQGVTNNGTINANVPVGTNGLALYATRISVFLNTGTIEATNGGEFGFDPNYGLGGNFTNTGTLTVAARSGMNLANGVVTNLVNGTLSGGTYNVTGTLQIPGNITTNVAKITLTGKASQILNPNTNALAGFLTNAAKGSFDLKGGQSFTSAGTFTNQGVITVSKGSTFTVGAGGSYVQTGGKITVNGKLTLSTAEGRTEESTSDSDPGTAGVRIAKGSLFGNGGTIAAHVSSSGTVIAADSLTATGKLGITGAYTQTSAGALDANIAGANAGQFSVLNVTGTATVGGTLNIKLLNNFVPTIGAEFEILTAKHVTGTFATVNGTVINNSEHFTVTYNSNNVTLTVVSGG